MLARTLLDLSQTAQISDSLKVGRHVLDGIGTHNALHKSNVEQAGFAVLKAPDIPSILVETAFISNPDEELKLRSERHQKKFADSIHEGRRALLRGESAAGPCMSGRARIGACGGDRGAAARRADDLQVQGRGRPHRLLERRVPGRMVGDVRTGRVARRRPERRRRPWPRRERPPADDTAPVVSRATCPSSATTPPRWPSSSARLDSPSTPDDIRPFLADERFRLLRCEFTRLHARRAARARRGDARTELHRSQRRGAAVLRIETLYDRYLTRAERRGARATGAVTPRPHDVEFTRWLRFFVLFVVLLAVLFALELTPWAQTYVRRAVDATRSP